MKTIHKTREEWLTACATELARVVFDRPLPKMRVTTGWPSKGAVAAKNRTIGQAWSPGSSADGTAEIIISLALDDPKRIADVLAHEMCHVIVGNEHGHKGPFAALAREIGLEGKMTATVAGPSFLAATAPILKRLGRYPGARIDATNQPKQSTRLIKCECEGCGYTVRITRKWIGVGIPDCPACEEEMTAHLPQDCEDVPELTSAERCVIAAIVNSDFAGDGGDAIACYLDCIPDTMPDDGPTGKALGGVLTSLQRKGILTIEGGSRDPEACALLRWEVVNQLDLHFIPRWD